MAKRIACRRCAGGRVVWTGDELQCLQCGWIPGDAALARLGLPLPGTSRPPRAA